MKFSVEFCGMAKAISGAALAGNWDAETIGIAGTIQSNEQRIW
jgi:hypothetical protein